MEHADIRLSVRRQSRLQRRPGTSVDILGTRKCRVLRTPKSPGTDSRSGIAKHAHGRFWRILLKKSFWGDERKFLEPLMRFARGDARDHIASSKISHRSS